MATQAVKVKNEESAATPSLERPQESAAGFRDGGGHARIHARRPRGNEASDLAEQGRCWFDHNGGDCHGLFLRRFLAVVDWLVQRGVAYVFKNLWCLKGTRPRWRCSGTSSYLLGL